MSQKSLAASDLSVLGWSPVPVSGEINHEETNDSRFVFVPADQIGAFEVRLSPLAWPAAGTKTLRVRLRQTGGSGPFSVLVWLLQGSTLIAARTINVTGSSFQTMPFELTATEFALITDFTDLRVKILSCNGSQIFTTSGSWTAPAGVTSVTAECWGAGGHGQGAIQGGGGGGGGGAYARKSNITVTPGNIYTVTVATASQPSSFFINETTVKAVNGQDGSVQNGGAGGSASACVGDVVFSGGNGGNSLGNNSGGGGGGSSSGTAAGGNGGNAVGAAGGIGGVGQGNGGPGGGSASSLTNGNTPGGGGGGGEGPPGTSGPGASGQVWLYW